MKSPETMLEEAVERNEQSIRRIQSRIERLKETLDDLEDLQKRMSHNGERQRISGKQTLETPANSKILLRNGAEPGTRDSSPNADAVGAR